MSSRIYELTPQKVEKDCRLSEYDTLNYPQIEWMNDIEEDERENDIDDLINRVLPKGMFSRVEGEEAIRYNGGYEEYKKEWFERMTKTMDSLKGENLGCDWQTIRTLLKMPTGNDSLIYDHEDYPTAGYWIGQWLTDKVAYLKEGDVLYIGGILRYS